MHDRGSAGDADGFAQERGFLFVAFDKVNFRRKRIGKRAGNHQTGEARAGTEIGPAAGFRRERKELQ